MAAHLTHLPPDILHSILGHVEAEDLAQLQQTCRLFNNFIKGNNPLWRVIYTNFLVRLRNWSSACEKVAESVPG